MAGRLCLQLPEQRAQTRVEPALGLRRASLQSFRDLLPQGRGLVEGDPVHHPARDALGLVSGAYGRLGRNPLGGAGSGARAQAHDGGQELPRDARGALAHPFQDHLGQDDGRQVLARGLVHHLYLVAGRHQPAQPLHRHVAAAARVVELAVPVPPHHPRPVAAFRLRHHMRKLTQRVKAVKGD
jgi:hypothetical protein